MYRMWARLGKAVAPSGYTICDFTHYINTIAVWTIGRAARSWGKPTSTLDLVAAVKELDPILTLRWQRFSNATISRTRPSVYPACNRTTADIPGTTVIADGDIIVVYCHAVRRGAIALYGICACTSVKAYLEVFNPAHAHYNRRSIHGYSRNTGHCGFFHVYDVQQFGRQGPLGHHQNAFAHYTADNLSFARYYGRSIAFASLRSATIVHITDYTSQAIVGTNSVGVFRPYIIAVSIWHHNCQRGQAPLDTPAFFDAAAPDGTHDATAVTVRTIACVARACCAECRGKPYFAVCRRAVIEPLNPVRIGTGGHAEAFADALVRADHLAQARAGTGSITAAVTLTDIVGRAVFRTAVNFLEPGNFHIYVYAVAASKNAVDFAANPSIGVARKRFNGTSSALGAILTGSEHHADIGAVAAFAIPGMTGCTVYGTGNPRAVGRSAGATIQSIPTLLHCNRTGGKSRTVINNIAIDEVPDGIRYSGYAETIADSVVFADRHAEALAAGGHARAGFDTSVVTLGDIVGRAVFRTGVDL